MRVKRVLGAFIISIALLTLGVLFIGNPIQIQEQSMDKDIVSVETYSASEPLKAKLKQRKTIRKSLRASTAMGQFSNRSAASTQNVPPLNPPNGAAYDDVFYKSHGTNPFIDTEDDNFSTFAMDVDTASYSVMRRYLRDGNLPPTAAVRVEEYINSFDYNYTPPTEEAFAVHLEGAPSRFGEGKRLQLLRIGIQGRVIPETDRKDAILTFVVDISGSMNMENRLGLVKRALTLLVDQLRPTDKVGIVVYGSNARVVLPHTGLENRDYILEAINQLRPDGSTNAEEGLRTGYILALKNSKSDCINRIILCSDGVANVGRTGPEDILKEIGNYVKEGVTLTTVGFGMGNYNDVLMEQLANKGNGSYAYVDTIKEAKRIFIENLTGTLQVIAKDAKIQVEFNPATVSRFRLLGYENRSLAHEDFRKDDVDAGEVGSGHSVTALYEIKLHENAEGKLATVFLRHEDPDTQKVTEVNETISTDELKSTFVEASPEFQLVASVAELAEILRESYWAKQGSLAAVQQTIEGAIANIHSNTPIHKERKEELLKLVIEARNLKEQAGG
ncbi:MAG: von Willebrand factor type A domain-containing protein [Candidatus Poribacteria bacterium]|nr:von Willebrand factor type A domain-containing protein [Candidatus Poribacteria bacterium]